MRDAARSRRLDVVQWLAGHLDRVFRTTVAEERIFPQFVNIDELNGPKGFAVARWLHAQNYSWLRLTASYSVLNKNARYRNYISWLFENQFLQGGNVIDYPATYGYLELVKKLHGIDGVRCSVAAMDGAAKNGHFETVKWLGMNRKEGCTYGALDGAIVNGHNSIAKWLIDNGFKGNRRVSLWLAVFNGNSEMVKWLFERFEKTNMYAPKVGFGWKPQHDPTL